MLIYRICDPDNTDVKPAYRGTIDEAKQEVRAEQPTFRGAIIVTQLTVDLDRATLLAILNGEAFESTEVRRWRGTARGGLAEDLDFALGKSSVSEETKQRIALGVDRHLPNAHAAAKRFSEGFDRPDPLDFYPEGREDTPSLEDGRDNCDDAGTGEGRRHGRM